MKFTNLNRKEGSQFYVLPTIIVARSYMGRRVFLVWFYWSIEL